MSVPHPPFHSASEELLYNIYLSLQGLQSPGNALKESDLNTFAKLNAILTDGDVMKAEEIQAALQALKGNVPDTADSLEKILGIIQGLSFLKRDELKTLQQLNDLLTDADVVSTEQLSTSLNALRGYVPDSANTLEKLLGIVQGLTFLKREEIDTIGELNAILTDADIVRTEELTAAIAALRGAVPSAADTLEKLYNIVQGLTFLKREEINTLQKLNTIITDAVLASQQDVTQAINSVRGNVPSTADTLEKLYGIFQGLTFLKREEIDTLQELNAILVDADVARASDLIGVFNDRGNHDASANLFPTSGGSGPGGVILRGNVWTISAPGILGGQSVVIGQTVRAKVDNPGQVAANWAISLYFTIDGNLILGAGMEGNARSIFAEGTAANVNLRLVPKGNGSIFLNAINAIYANTHLVVQKSDDWPRIVALRAQIVPDNATVATIQLEGFSNTGQNRVFARLNGFAEKVANQAEYGRLEIKVIRNGVETAIARFSSLKNMETEFLGPVKLPHYTMATLPPAANHSGSIIYVTNEEDGPTLAFSDGVNWRKTKHRPLISDMNPDM